MERDDQARLETRWALCCQLLATVAGLVSGAMALVMLWAGWQKEHGVLRPADAPCLTTLPRMTMGLSLLGAAYSLYTAWQERGEEPVGNNRLLLAAAALSAVSAALESHVLFFRTDDLPARQRLDAVLDVLE